MQINSMICAVIRFRNDESIRYAILAAVILLLYEKSGWIFLTFLVVFFSCLLSEWSLACEITCGYHLPLRFSSFSQCQYNLRLLFDQWENWVIESRRDCILIWLLRRVFHFLKHDGIFTHAHLSIPVSLLVIALKNWWINFYDILTLQWHNESEWIKPSKED